MKKLIHISFFVAISLTSSLIYLARSQEISTTTMSYFNISYDPNPLIINKDEQKALHIFVVVNPNKLDVKSGDNINFQLNLKTIVPHFDILQNKSEMNFDITLPDNFKFNQTIDLFSSYIGRAKIDPMIKLKNSNQTYASMQLNVISIKKEGPVEILFGVSIAIMILLVYVNMGCQLNEDNIKKILQHPFIFLSGLIISTVTMPVVTWLVITYLYPNQHVFTIGALVLACTSSASASAMWSAMLNADKELAVGLHIISSICSTFTMPISLYILGLALPGQEGAHQTFPYSRLISSLFSVVAALGFGWFVLSKNEKATKYCEAIYKKLMLTVLSAIIVMSSLIYWYIYAMFTWSIVSASFTISFITYSISLLLGYLASFNLDSAIAISISSTYKNSGISFAVLVLAFDPPNNYIAFVPSLALVLSTSISMYFFFTISLISRRLTNRRMPVSQEVDDKPAVICDTNQQSENAKQRLTENSSNSKNERQKINATGDSDEDVNHETSNLASYLPGHP